VSGTPRSLLALTVGCAVAAAIFGFGAEVFSWRSAYAGEAGRVTLIQVSRLAVLVALAVLLALRGGWWGIPAAAAMALAATAAEWALFPIAYEWAALDDPEGYARRFGEVSRPGYGAWSTYDVIAALFAAALAQGLRTVAGVSPTGPRDG